MATAGPIYYVYEHWRADKNECFWVGKGKENRAWDFRRSNHYNNIVRKLSSLGMCVEVRLICSGLEEADALKFEKGRIAFWRAQGINLANVTDGGEGVSGLKHTEETKKKMSVAASTRLLGHTVSEETRKKISDSNMGREKGAKHPAHSAKLKGRKLSIEHRAAIGESMKGRILNEQSREKIRASNTGQLRSEDAKLRMSMSHIGKRPSIEVLRKMSAAQEQSWACDQERRMVVGDKSKANWKNPGYRDKVLAARSSAMADPAYREKQRIAMKEIWKRRKESKNFNNNR